MGKRYRRPPTLKQKLGLVAFGLVLLAVGLVAVEWCLRQFRIGDDFLYGDPFVAFAAGRPLFEEQIQPDGEVVYRTAAAKTAYFNEQKFPAHKAAETYRVFTLGGSTTAGRPYDDKVSFSGWLRVYLTEMDPSRRWEVVNAGAISYASYRIVLLMKELVRYSPDLFVVYTGHNEFLEERAYPESIHGKMAWKRLWIWLNGLRSYGIARRSLQTVLPRRRAAATTLAAEVAAKPDDWTGMDRYQRDPELEAAIVAHFEYNLHKMAEIARANGVEMIFIQPVSNLKDFSPFKSEHSSGLQTATVARFQALLEQGRELLEAGDAGSAMTVVSSAVELDPEFAEAQFLLGKAHLGLANYPAAQRAFIRAKDLDVAPLRALASMVSLTAQVGTRYGVPVVDLPATLAVDSRARFGHEILGGEYLLDHVHPGIPVHRRIAQEIIDILKEQGVVRPGAAWSASNRQAVENRVLATIDRRYYAERDLNLAKVLGWAGKTLEAEEPLRRAAEVLPENPEVLLNLGILLEKQQRWEEALGYLERAVALAPETPETYFNLGVVLAGLERSDEALGSLLRALELRPDYPEALYNLGVLYRQRSSLADAKEVLERALRVRPGAPEVLRQLGLVYRRLELWDEAAASFQRALDQEPEDAIALAGLGGTYARLERFAEAEKLLKQATRADPSMAEAHFDLGVVYARQGRQDHALVAYELAVEADPQFAPAHNNRGILLGARGELETARRSLQLAIDSDPDYAEAYFNLGVVYDGAGQGAEALRLIRRATELEPANARFHLALGLLLLARGDVEGARSHVAQARAGGETVAPELLAKLQL